MDNIFRKKRNQEKAVKPMQRVEVPLDSIKSKQEALDAPGLLNKGLSFADLGRQEEAMGCCDKALAINPQYAEAWVCKATLLADLGRHVEAIGCYDKALAINPKHADTWCRKCLSLVALRRRNDAMKCLERLQKLDPELSQELARCISSIQTRQN